MILTRCEKAWDAGYDEYESDGEPYSVLLCKWADEKAEDDGSADASHVAVRDIVYCEAHRFSKVCGLASERSCRSRIPLVDPIRPQTAAASSIRIWSTQQTSCVFLKLGWI